MSSSDSNLRYKSMWQALDKRLSTSAPTSSFANTNPLFEAFWVCLNSKTEISPQAKSWFADSLRIVGYSGPESFNLFWDHLNQTLLLPHTVRDLILQCLNWVNYVDPEFEAMLTKILPQNQKPAKIIIPFEIKGTSSSLGSIPVPPPMRRQSSSFTTEPQSHVSAFSGFNPNGGPQGRVFSSLLA